MYIESVYSIPGEKSQASKQLRDLSATHTVTTIPFVQLPEVGLEEVPALPDIPLQQAAGFFLPQP